MLMRRIVLLLIFTSFHTQASISFRATPLTPTTKKITLTIPLRAGDAIYKEYLSLSVDHPGVILSEWQTDQEAIARYDPTFKETKKVFTKPCTISLTATKNGQSVEDANLHLYLYQRSEKQIREHVFPLRFAPKKQKSQSNENAIEDALQSEPITHCVLPNRLQPIKNKDLSLSIYIDALAQRTQSMWLRILGVLLLGILLSLTPCTYPMIPITVGILQGHLKKLSYLNCFFTSLFYTLGLASVFGAFGALMTFASKFTADLLATPVFTFAVVSVLVYCAFSMFGLYPLYIPRFLRQRKEWTKGGAFTSAFLFGAASGTVATPCLAPGLILLLMLVVQLGNPFIAGVLLFIFGVGVSVPLLVVGTAPKAMRYLPRAGTWMIDINKIFGLILLATCFYFLSSILPWQTLLTLIALFLALIGLFYLYASEHAQTNIGKRIKGTTGIALLVHAVLIFAASYKATYVPQQIVQHKQTQANRPLFEIKKPGIVIPGFLLALLIIGLFFL